MESLNLVKLPRSHPSAVPETRIRQPGLTRWALRFGALLLLASCGGSSEGSQATLPDESSSSSALDQTTPTTDQPAAPQTTRQPNQGEVVDPPCDDASDCAFGFQLDGRWFGIDCIPLHPASVSDEEMGQGSVTGVPVSVHRMRGVGSDVLVALLAPASFCGIEGEGNVPRWTAAQAGGADPEQLAFSMCRFGDLTTDQLEEYRCEQQAIASPPLTDRAIADATEFMDEFLRQLRSEDAGTARSMWESDLYGGSDEEAEERWAVFLAAYAWLASPDVTVDFTVVPSAAFTDPNPVVVLVAQDSAALTATFVLSQPVEDQDPAIYRLPKPLERAEDEAAESWIVPPPGSTLEPGPIITFPVIPVEGNARAFVGGREIRAVYVDYNEFTTTVGLPEDIIGEVVLTLTLATPEDPTAISATFVVQE